MNTYSSRNFVAHWSIWTEWNVSSDPRGNGFLFRNRKCVSAIVSDRISFCDGMAYDSKVCDANCGKSFK